MAARIQHTQVSPDAAERQIRQLCQECLSHGFDGAMVQPCWVPLARSILSGSGVMVCTAFGYPMGGDSSDVKSAAARDCFLQGADEVDFMPNWGFLKSGYDDRVLDEIKAVVQIAEGRVVKVMLELGMLSQDEGKRAAEISLEAGVQYLKNSSGFGKGGQATVEAVKRLKGWAAGRARIKASGGVRTFEQAVALLNAGADLIGSSSGLAIVSATQGMGDY